MADVRRAIRVPRSYLPAARARELDAKARAYWVLEATNRTRQMRSEGHVRSAAALAWQALLFFPPGDASLHVWARILELCVRTGMAQVRRTVSGAFGRRHPSEWS